MARLGRDQHLGLTFEVLGWGDRGPIGAGREERSKHLFQEGVGHYGVFAGSVFDAQIYPRIRDFIELASVRS